MQWHAEPDRYRSVVPRFPAGTSYEYALAHPRCRNALERSVNMLRPWGLPWTGDLDSRGHHLSPRHHCTRLHGSREHRNLCLNEGISMAVLWH